MIKHWRPTASTDRLAFNPLRYIWLATRQGWRLAGAETEIRRSYGVTDPSLRWTPRTQVPD
ncbi:hypothetical protein DVH05_004368 [Phytophthora capsici]|nr:hypothetical protein DVH05_004368 [Phytophthora capsici]